MSIVSCNGEQQKAAKFLFLLGFVVMVVVIVAAVMLSLLLSPKSENYNIASTAR